jgi:hypothetical protein
MASTFINGTRPPYAREAVGTITSAKSLTAATYNTATANTDVYNRHSQTKRPEEALIQVKTAAINWTINGTTPTTTATTDIGFVSQAGDIISLTGYAAISGFQCINAVASSGASVEVVYFR